MGPTGRGFLTYGGWNIDDVIVGGTPWPLVSGQVYVDANGNGILDAGETGLAGAKVFLDSNGNGLADPTETATTTDAGGFYQFNVTLGSNTLCAVVPTGFVAVTAASRSMNVSGTLTGQNFALFPTVFTATAASASYYVTASNGIVQISGASTPSATPTYQIAANLLPSLTFNLNGTDESLFTDFSGGALGVNVTLNSTYGNNGQLTVIGAGTAQSFSLTDYQVGLTAGGGLVYFNNLDTLNLFSSAVHYSGQFATLNTLFIHSGCIFYWGA
jgi:hypothetical protein